MDGPRFDTPHPCPYHLPPHLPHDPARGGSRSAPGWPRAQDAAADCKKVGRGVLSGDNACCKDAECQLGVCQCKPGFYGLQRQVQGLQHQQRTTTGGASKKRWRAGRVCCRASVHRRVRQRGTCLPGRVHRRQVRLSDRQRTLRVRPAAPPSRRAAMRRASRTCSPTRTTAGHAAIAATNRAAVATAGASPAFSPMRTTAAAVASSARGRPGSRTPKPAARARAVICPRTSATVARVAMSARSARFAMTARGESCAGASAPMPRVALIKAAATGIASTWRTTGTTAAAATAPATTPRSAPTGDVSPARPAGSRAATSAAYPLLEAVPWQRFQPGPEDDPEPSHVTRRRVRTPTTVARCPRGWT